MTAAQRTLRLHPLAWACLAAIGPLGAFSPSAHAQTDTTNQRVEVIGTSPLPGQGVARDALPYNTQVVKRGALDAAQADNATDFLARRLPGVQVNDIQGTPFQGDLTFRGFRASGVVGASQGMSVYIDGVRVNEPFGDVVNWDMVPEFAIDAISLVPGANPAFGLNSLGGALVFNTASGKTAPGLRGEASLGSFGRKNLWLSHGGAQDSGWTHYLGAGAFDENGWRDFSPSRVKHLVGKLSRRVDAGELTLNLLAGDSRMVGNNLLPEFTFDEAGTRTPDLGAARPASVYNHPDETRNRVRQLSLQWRGTLASEATLEALAYMRHTRRQGVNGDEAGTVAPPVTASLNRVDTRQHATGAALALSQKSGAHQWQVGTSVDESRVRFEQTEQEATFDASRGVVALDEAPELSAAVRGRTRSIGLYATDTWRVADGTHVTGTLRFNHARVSNALTTVDDSTNVLTALPEEAFSYRSANPALGIAHQIAGGPTLFANLARNNRVPTVIELGCADPDTPCRLPAGLQSDPYLKQVVSTSFETGLRWAPAGLGRGSLTLFRTNNRDDILFRSVSVAGQLGYFQNFPRTRHQGLDAEWALRRGAFDIGLAYSHLQATYQASGTLRLGQRNVLIEPGTRIAGLPRHLFKASLDWNAGGGWTVGGDMQATGRRVTAGNEDGRIADGGDTGFDFSLPGYAIVNLRASFKPATMPGLELYARVSNLFDRRHASFAALGQTVFDAQGAYTGDERDALFTATGAPRAFSMGLRWAF